MKPRKSIWDLWDGYTPGQVVLICVLLGVGSSFVKALIEFIAEKAS